MKSALSILAIVLVLPYACAPVYRFAPTKRFSGAHFYNPYAASFPWHRANLHAHGRAWLGVTSAAQTDSEVVRAYRARGYDVAAISDYQQITTLGPDALPVYEHGFNIGKHHQLAIGARGVAWFDLPLWQGIDQKQYVIGRVAETAALVAIAHPAALQGYAYSDDELRQLGGYQLMEVINGRFTTESSWDAALSAGRAVWVIGDDDTHDVTKADRFAVAWNEIAAPSASPSDLIEALRAGRTYAILQLPDTAGPETTLIRVAEHGGVITIELAGRPADISFVGQEGVVRKTAEDTTSASYTFTDDDTYIRAVARTPTRMLFVNPVVRYDGIALPVHTATIAPWPTWIERIGIFTICGVLAAGIMRRRRARGESLQAKESWRRVVGFVILVAAAAPVPARAQDRPAPPPGSLSAPTPFETSFPADLLTELPTGDSVFSLLETTDVEAISDRVSTGGLGFGSAPHLSAFGSAITQTRYRIGDVDITDPAAGGTPLLIPELFLWQRVSAASGLSSPSFITPGMGVTLEPRRPTAQWTTTAEGTSSFGDALTATGAGVAPPIARLTGWNRGSVLTSGPLAADRAGVVIGGAWTRAAQTNLGSSASVASDVASAFAHLVVTVSPHDEVRTLAIVQRTTFPAALPAVYAAAQPSLADTSVHLQSTWARDDPDRMPFRVFAGYTQRDRTPQSALAQTAVLERLTDGPPMMAGNDTGARTDRLIAAGGRATIARGIHAVEAGVDLTVARSSADAGLSGVVGETVDGTPARLWQFTAPGFTSHRQSATAAVFARDELRLSERSHADLSVRYERVAASAQGAAQGLTWNTVLPSAMLVSVLSVAHRTQWFVGGAVSAYQLPLDTLAWGDPAAPSIDVFRWTGGALAPTASARLLNVGPGATGRIDPNLRRPYSDDLTFGIEGRPARAWPFTLQLAGLCRWEKELFGVVNESPHAPAYSIVNVNDPGLDLASASTAQVLPVFNLVLPASGYQFDNVLTNAAGATARRLGAKLVAEYTGQRLFILFGAAAYEAEGVASSRGFLSSENDQGLVGEELLDPNASIYDRGRLFGDRAFAGKVAGVYRFAGDVTLGAVARYHDGQPFARLVIVPDLNQGPEIVRAFASGGSRFTFTATLDLRIQKTFTTGGHHAAVFLDAYNVTNRSDEVEERVVTGAAFRTPTAIQPPRSLHAGARVSF